MEVVVIVTSTEATPTIIMHSCKHASMVTS